MARRPCPNPEEACPYFTDRGSCFSDNHHLYWPRVDYRRGLEREFRELPENKQQLCRWEHDEIHATQEPPAKPSLEIIRRALGLLVGNYEDTGSRSCQNEIID